MIMDFDTYVKFLAIKTDINVRIRIGFPVVYPNMGNCGKGPGVLVFASPFLVIGRGSRLGMPTARTMPVRHRTARRGPPIGDAQEN